MTCDVFHDRAFEQLRCRTHNRSALECARDDRDEMPVAEMRLWWKAVNRCYEAAKRGSDGEAFFCLWANILWDQCYG